MTLDKQRQETRRKENDLKKRMKAISEKAEADRTEEEKQSYALFEERRQRKNKRSRERTRERKSEYIRIMDIPEQQRTEQEREWLMTFMKAKKRKNEGDRMRRERIKRGLFVASSYEEGFSDSGNEGTATTTTTKTLNAE